MPSSHQDEVRDYGFADKALALRKRAGLTQRELAELLGVSARAVHAWEGGTSYPDTEHLMALIALCLERGTFAAGREAEEAAALWASVHASGVRRAGPFDSAWFAGLRRGGAMPVPVAPPPGRGEITAQHHDWGEAPAESVLQGRAGELAILTGWVREEGCRVVQVLGAGGIGKTALAARLAYDLAPEFPVVYWRSLRNALPVEEWLDGAISALSAAQALPPEGLEARLRQLLGLLRERRGLLVLDNLETILEPGAPGVRYRAGYEGYGEALRRLSESGHRGCLLLTSRERPLRADEPAVRSLRLGGLGVADGRALLSSRDLTGDAAAWGELVERYAGNPLALRVVGESIEAVFGGEIAAFLAQEAAVFGGIRQLLDEQVARLSVLERSVLTWLAVEREPVGFAELVADLGPGVGRAEAVEAMEALRRRSLLESGGRGTFTLQPVVLEYATAQLVAQASREILAGAPALLASHALVKAQSKDYVRRSQERLIAQPLLSELRTRGGSAAVERRLLALLAGWRGWSEGRQSYGPGNVVNLLRLLRGELRGLDLARLAIRQAYLQEVEMQDASLAGAHLAEVVLAEAFNFPSSVALSADGARLLVGMFTGEVCLWRVADRTLLLAERVHAGEVMAVALSGDGELVASAGLDGTVKLWEARSGRLLATLEGHTGVVWLALSGDGQLLASGGQDGTIRLWETRSGRTLATLQGHRGGILAVALSGDGQLVASSGTDGTVRLWKATLGSDPGAPGQLLATLQGHTGGVYHVALSGDGTLVASGSADGAVRLWEVPSGRPLATLQGHAGGVWSVVLSRGGKLVASGSADGAVRLWEAPSGRPLATLRGHAGPIRGVALSGDGRLLVSASQDGMIRLWEVMHGDALSGVGSPARPLTTLQGYTGAVWGVALSGDGRLAASGGHDGIVRLWEPESGRLLTTLRGHTGGIRAVTLSEDGRLVASGSDDGTIRLWEWESGRLLALLQGHSSVVYGVALSGDGHILASGSFDGTVRLWEAFDGRPLATLEGHSSVVYRVTLSRDGHILASTSFDETVKVWEVLPRDLRAGAGSAGRLLATLRGHTGGVHDVAISEDGRLLASAGLDGTIKVWEVPPADLGASDGSPGRLLATLQGHTGPIRGVALSDDGRLAASGGEDGTVRLWETAATAGYPEPGSWRLLETLQGHTGLVMSVALTGDGRLLASASFDGTVRLWGIAHRDGSPRPGIGSVLHTLRSDRRYERMDITGLTGVTEAQRMALKALGAVTHGT